MKTNNPDKYPDRIGEKWDDIEVAELLQEIQQHISFDKIAESHKRTLTAITSRLRRIACDKYSSGVDIDNIIAITGLSKLEISNAVKKHNTSLHPKTVELNVAVKKIKPHDASLSDMRDLLNTINEKLDRILTHIELSNDDFVVEDEGEPPRSLNQFDS